MRTKRKLSKKERRENKRKDKNIRMIRNTSPVALKTIIEEYAVENKVYDYDTLMQVHLDLRYTRRQVEEALDILYKDPKFSEIIHAYEYKYAVEDFDYDETKTTTTFVISNVSDGDETDNNITQKDEEDDMGKKRKSVKATKAKALQIKRMVTDYKTCRYTYAQLSDKYGFSIAYISTVMNQYISKDEIKFITKKRKLFLEKEKEKEDDKKKEVESDSNNVVKISEKDIEIVDNNQSKHNTPTTTTKHVDCVEIGYVTNFPDEFFTHNILKINKTDVDESYTSVGLVKDRHDMDVDKFIYDKIDDGMVTNFSYMESIAMRFIKKNVKPDPNKISEKSLYVKATGLQTALASVIKVCHRMEVNLYIEHYQMTRPGSNGIYKIQPIFIDFPCRKFVPYNICEIANKSNNLYLYKSDLKDYNKAKEFYELFVVTKPSHCRLKRYNDMEASILDTIGTDSLLTTSMEDGLVANALLAHQYSINREYYRSIFWRKYTLNEFDEYNFELLQKAYF